MINAGTQMSFDGMGLDDLVARSIALLREHEPPEGYYGCFSGGKDSCVIKHLAKMAGVKVAWHYNVTTIDPPELIYFMREHHRDVKWVRSPHGNFFRRMETRYNGSFPTRRMRWCCQEYKESRNPAGASLLLGIRAEESARRARAWQEVTHHTGTNAPAILPILSWPSEELWRFVHGEGLPYCSLYDEGFHRLGCIGCPMAMWERARQFERWPRYEARWKLAFKRIWNSRAAIGKPWAGSRFSNWRALWDWWMTNDSLPAMDDGPLLEGNHE